MTGWRIVCDAGGTNLRCARSHGPSQLSDAQVIASEERTGIADVLMSYASRFPDAENLQGAAIAAAGPIEDGCVRLTNRDMVIDRAHVSRALGGKPVALLNDLEAAALALPALKEGEMDGLIARANPLNGPRLVINVGTGFGGALLVRTRAGWHAVACEPGHMTLALPASEAANLSDPVSVEDVISGLTLSDKVRRQRLWSFAGKFPSTQVGDLFAVRETDESADSFVLAFSRLLGQVCGDLVLACGAWGGVHLCGSVASAWSRAGGIRAFQGAFESKGPMTSRMQRVDVNLITAKTPVLTGLCQVPL
jgi:glucokinase